MERVLILGGLGRNYCRHAHHRQHKSKSWGLRQGFLEVPVTFGVLGSGFSLPYLWGHSANGGQVITSAQEVRSVDLQLKVAQPLDNGLWALQEKKKVAMVSLSLCRFCKSHLCLSSPDLSSRHSFINATVNSSPTWNDRMWTFWTLTLRKHTNTHQWLELHLDTSFILSVL